MSGLLATGSSALLAFQRAMATTGHNIANAATPGYSRQRVDLAARVGQLTGAGHIGAGVDVDALQRLADGLSFARQIDSSGELGRLRQSASMTSRLDALMSDSATTLSQPWSAFFGAAEELVADPSSTVARSQLLDRGRQLAARWQLQDSQLSRMEREADSALRGKIDDANQLAGEIARLNRDIAAAGSNASPDLLDQRALRIDKLAALVGANAVEQDGMVNVFTTGGQPLVLGNRAMALTTQPDPYRPERAQIAVQGSGGAIVLPAGAVSGEIGGLMDFRDRVLDPARVELGRLATAFAISFNETHRGGVDANGDAGGDVFSLPPPRMQGHTANAGSASFAASIDDVGALTGHDLVLRYDGAAWSATRAGSGEPVALSGIGTAADPLRVGGVALTMAGAPAAGDRFLLQPTAAASGGIAMTLDDPAKVAAAQPLQATLDPGNVGGARASSSRITDAAAFAGFAGATIEFIDETQYTIDGAGPFAYTPGTPIAGSGWELTLEGTPAAGDGFTLARTPPRSSDNGNARLLAALDDRGVLAGGVSVTTAMSQLVGNVGAEAQHAQLGLEAQSAIHEQVLAEVDSLSGVNLDEEAANLLRFQQAYQAAAQVISTADSVFQTLLSAVRS